MPNGHDKNWIRLLAAVDGFRIRYGAWPKRVRMFPLCLQDLKESIFSPQSFAQLLDKLDLIAEDGAEHVAEDDLGNRYCYGSEGFPDHRPHPSAEEWLSVCPDLHGEIH